MGKLDEPTYDNIVLANQLLEQQLINTRKKCVAYQKGFDILMEYFDSISDEEKAKVDKQLIELGL